MNLKRHLHAALAIGLSTLFAVSALAVAAYARRGDGKPVADVPAPVAAATQEPQAPPAPAPTPTVTEAPTPEPTAPPTPEPTPEAPQPPRLYDLAALREQYGNDDIVGYLDIPGTSVSYAVPHARDNEYYLKRNEYGQQDVAGSIFLDCENSATRLNYNTILYGHNMKKNIMFHAIRYYVDKSFYEKHKYIVFETDAGPNVWEVCAFFRARVDFQYTQTIFYSEKQYLKLAEEFQRRSMYDTGVTLGEGDKTLVLSTCTNEDPNTRFVLVAARVKDISALPEEAVVSLYSQEFYDELHAGDAPAE